MNKSMSSIIMLALSSASLYSMNAAAKETICHNYGQISVSDSAVQTHLNHGDIVKEDGVDCPRRPGSEPEAESGDTMAAVVMMRCEAQGDDVVVVSFSASFDFASIAPVEPADCPGALANLLDRELTLRSVTGGSAETDGTLHLYTDYLLIGEISADEEE